jgi:hypothetical protein
MHCILLEFVPIDYKHDYRENLLILNRTYLRIYGYVNADGYIVYILFHFPVY